MKIPTALKFIIPIAALLLAMSFTNHDEKKASRPNIILIMADDLGYETLTCNGGESYQTPHLDKLAGDGIRFTRAYATPLCTPSRVQIMTGKYNFRNYERFGLLKPTEKTFANYFRDAGYKTAIAGKWQLGGDEQSPAHFGFDKYCLWQLYKGDFWNRYKNPRITKDGVRLTEQQTENQYGPDLFTDYILDFISSNKKKPFFVYYPMALVHDPFQPTPDHADFDDYQLEGLNDTTYFRNMMKHMDGQVGKIVSHLKKHKLLENTIIVFTGDNGTDRDVVSTFEGQRIQGQKGLTTDAGTHVPMIVYAKGRVATTSTYNNLVDFTDVMPSLLSMAGIKQDKGGDGVSFWQNLTGEQSEVPRNSIFCSYSAKKDKFPNEIWAQDTAYKLYATGKFYHFIEDLKEEKPLDTEALSATEKEHYQALQKHLSQYLPEAQQFIERP